MEASSAIGPWLREVRLSRGLTLEALGRRVDCTPSLLSLVERGKRPMQPWLARRLEHEFSVPGLLTSASDRRRSAEQPAMTDALRMDDILLLHLPDGSDSVAISRRALLASLAVGAVRGPTLGMLGRFFDPAHGTAQVISQMHQTFRNLADAARVMHPSGVIDAVLAHTALVDVLRQQIAQPLGHELLRLQARCAELLSWMHEELGDAQSAAYWIDRATQWAQQANWVPMVAYAHVRRSMLALSYFDDPRHAIEHATMALATAGTTRRVQGLAAKQLAFGAALVGREEDSKQALDLAMRHLASDATDDGSRDVGQRSVVDDELFAIFQATCDLYLGRPESALNGLEPRLAKLGAASTRTMVITTTKVVQAYARAGAAETVEPLLVDAVARVDSIGSGSARRELQRAVPAMAYWDRRPEVRKIVDDLRSPTQPLNR